MWVSDNGSGGCLGLEEHFAAESPVVCDTWVVNGTCTIEQAMALEDGSAVVVNDVVVSPVAPAW